MYNLFFGSSTSLGYKGTVVSIRTLHSVSFTSLTTGVFPESFKSAVVVPILKKPGLDVDMVANCRPISHLSFLSKVFEKVVFKQLTEHLSTICLKHFSLLLDQITPQKQL